MCGVMTDKLQHTRIVAPDEFGFCVAGDGLGEIAQDAVEKLATKRLANEGEILFTTSNPQSPALNRREGPSENVTPTMHQLLVRLLAEFQLFWMSERRSGGFS
jgi:hypothetical protein